MAERTITLKELARALFESDAEHEGSWEHWEDEDTAPQRATYEEIASGLMDRPAQWGEDDDDDEDVDGGDVDGGE